MVFNKTRGTVKKKEKSKFSDSTKLSDGVLGSTKFLFNTVSTRVQLMLRCSVFSVY